MLIFSAPRRRRGFSLSELLIAMTLFALVGLAIINVFLRSQRVFHAQIGEVQLASQTRAGAFVLTSAVRALDAADSEIVSMGDSSLTVKSTEQVSFLCTVPTSPYASIAVRTAQSYGLRTFAAQDSVVIFADNDTTTSADDQWLHGIITAVGTGTCTDGSAATTLTVSITGAGNSQLSLVRMGGPVRSIELDQYVLYVASDGYQYLGRSSLVSGSWTALDQVAGPLVSGNGIALTYYDSTGTNTTTTPTNVRSVGIVVRGQGPTSTALGGGVATKATDSITTLIALRNNPHS